LELLGAGMIHPNVLREGWLNPDEYSGFAFGIGLTRLVAIKHGLKDIRLLTNGDLRFVKSF
jgi:phenylalanyl-tRNA synthetase alpha chain